VPTQKSVNQEISGDEDNRSHWCT